VGTISYSAVSSTVTDITDIAGLTWRITGAGPITGIRRPGASSDTISVTRSGSQVTSVTNHGVTTNYSRTVSGTTATMVVTNALSQQSTIVSDLGIGRPTSVTDPLSRTISYQYDTEGRPTRVTRPEGDYTQLTYDVRGNVTETRNVAKSGSGLADIVATASYDTTCSNPITCNQPNSVTDARGNTTDYAYDATHGGVTNVTGPAPTGGATRPQTRYAYTLTNDEYRLTSVSTCSSGTASSCVGTAAESRTVIGYDTLGRVTSVEQRDGTGALSATTTATYTTFGDVASVDRPLSGTADTVYFRYDAGRRLVGTVSPDPDGSGSLTRRAVRTTLSSTTGLPTKVEQGTVAGTSDTDWASFSASQGAEADYDANARPVVQRLVSGSTVYALTQMSYDALARPECAAQRMNPAEFASLPSSACSLDTEGSYGPDRIVKRTYDSAGQVTLVQSGYGVTGVQADEVATTYTSNGQAATLTDGEGNRTTYEYDGHDRLVKTRFPSATRGAGTSSTTDYEQLTLDAGGLVTSRRIRDGNSIGYTVDALGRVTAKDLPGSDPDVSYTYNLLNQLTGASQTGHSLSFTYDALGRRLTETGPLGTMTSTFDVAGRRTRLTYADTNYVDYDHLVTGELSAVRENGAGSGVGVLAAYAYDNMGRRTSLTRGNGSAMTYSYDAVSRLTGMSDDLVGTGYDQSLTLGYNPAGQIVSANRSNDSYAFTGLANQNRTDTHDGINHVDTTGTTTAGHDARGNTNALHSALYGHDSENRMTSASGSVAMAYDPLGRLYQLSDPTGTTRFQYDGAEMAGEYNGSSSLQRRYARGEGADEPLVWYEGSGLTDRRFLHADERGSIVARSDGSANGAAVNRYDEYGYPQGQTVSGRFGYTGQAWLPELAMYSYKSRIYNPGFITGGRFMEPDRIGYGDGMNLYGYVSGDPVNSADPSGTTCQLINVGYSWFDPLTGEKLGPAPGDYYLMDCSGAPDSEGNGSLGMSGFFEGGWGGGPVGGNSPPLTCTGRSSGMTNQFRVRETPHGNNLERRWIAGHAGAVFQHVTQDLTFSDGRHPQHTEFWEAWQRTGHGWPLPLGGTDTFYVPDGSQANGIDTFTVSAEAWFERGGTIPSSWYTPTGGQAPQSGNGPSSYVAPSMNQPIGPITITYICNRGQ
jgi:RHS repeat-associated protein